jgi:hypothetical protein
MTAITEGLNLGDLLKYEAPNLYSREQVTVVAGQNLELGAVVGRITATAKFKVFDPAATDGSELPAGILLGACDATLIDRDDALLLARHGMVASNAVVWPAGITVEQKTTALAQMSSLGVLVRQGV